LEGHSLDILTLVVVGLLVLPLHAVLTGEVGIDDWVTNRREHLLVGFTLVVGLLAGDEEGTRSATPQ